MTADSSTVDEHERVASDHQDTTLVVVAPEMDRNRAGECLKRILLAPNTAVSLQAYTA